MLQEAQLNLTELRRFLSEHNLHPKKRLSQNFLIDRNVAEKIIRTADVQAGETILEVGPGAGALTRLLLDRGAHVIAVEKDEQFAHLLQGEHLTVYAEDILSFPLEKLPTPIKVVANLPYQITSPLLTKLVACDGISRIIVMVQDEVARRYTAKPGTSDYGSITVFLNAHCDISYAFKVSRRCFYPAPKVDSAIIDLIPKPCALPQDFFTLVRCAFGKRRKMLRASLKEHYPHIVQALKKLKIKETARPEELSLEQLVALYEQLKE